eukprot:SRR837773.3349.p1 GENE.SRR837773.3349~~SRR837773.3349.p1  ORF type:complete len:365 (+),score=173.12 SRR837773.3349:63-1097(+)
MGWGGKGKFKGKFKGKGKGKGKMMDMMAGGWGWGPPAAMQGEDLPTLENKLTTAVDDVYQKLLDLNCEQSSVGSMLNKLLDLRGKVLAGYGVPSETWTPPAAGAPPASAEEIPWKNKLNEAAGKKVLRQLTKGEFEFDTQEDGAKQYVSTVTSATIFANAAEYVSEPCASKRLAEHMAAKAAIEGEFPEFYAAIMAGAPVAKGTKRKTATEGADPRVGEGKSHLLYVVQMLLGRPATKEDVLYDVTETAEGSGVFTATVKVPGHNGGADTWAGEEAKTRKDAEMSAASIAAAALEETAAPLIEAHKQRKLEKQQEMMAKKRARHEGKGGKGAAKGTAVTPGPIA